MVGTMDVAPIELIIGIYDAHGCNVWGAIWDPNKSYVVAEINGTPFRSDTRGLHRAYVPNLYGVILGEAQDTGWETKVFIGKFDASKDLDVWINLYLPQGDPLKFHITNKVRYKSGKIYIDRLITCMGQVCTSEYINIQLTDLY